jgi:hypothetical protein
MQRAKFFLALVLLGCSFNAFAAIYDPDDLVEIRPVGASNFIYFGWTIAAYNDTLAVSAPINDYQRGSVFVFVRESSTSWKQQAEIVPPGGAAGGFGSQDVGLCGNTLIATEISDTFTVSVDIYVRRGTTWAFQQQLRFTGPERYGTPRIHAALDGDRLVVLDLRTSLAYPYRRVNGHWSRQGVLRRDENTPMWQSLAMSDDLLVFGAPRVAEGAYGVDAMDGRGSLSIYALKSSSTSSNDEWVRQGRVGPKGYKLGAVTFGANVDVSRTHIIAGSYSEDGYAGAAYVFARGSDGKWTQTARLQSVDNSPARQFGRQVAIHYDRAAVSAPSIPADGDQNDRSVDVFMRDSGKESWSRRDRLRQGYARGASSIALSNCGVFVGSRSNGEGGNYDRAFALPQQCAAPIVK